MSSGGALEPIVNCFSTAETGLKVNAATTAQSTIVKSMRFFILSLLSVGRADAAISGAAIEQVWGHPAKSIGRLCYSEYRQLGMRDPTTTSNPVGGRPGRETAGKR